MQSAKYTIKEMVQAIQNLDFGDDTCSLNCYIQKRMQNNDISKIMNMERPNISPAVYNLFQYSQSTTAALEGSFSVLQKLLATDRNF